MIIGIFKTLSKSVKTLKMSLYGIFSHSKHISFSMKKLNFVDNLKLFEGASVKPSGATEGGGLAARRQSGAPAHIFYFDFHS